MTAQIDGGYELLGEWETDLLDESGEWQDGIDADLNAVQQEGNVLGAGELWQRLGSTQGPVVPSESVAMGYRVGSYDEPGWTFSPKNNPSVIPWRGEI